MKDQNIETKIKAIQQYFIDKIMAKEFDITSTCHHHIKIRIDKKYYFLIWIANGPTHIRPYCGIGEYFMELDFPEELKGKLYSILEPDIIEAQNSVLQEKRKKLAELKKELGES
jgi:hypothetical protein